MAIENVNSLFDLMNESVLLLKKELELSYFESLIETGQNISENGMIPAEYNLTESTNSQLKSIYSHILELDATSEDFRKAMQLAIIKGTKEDYIQPNHQMTPDAIGLLMAFLVDIFVELDNDSVSLLDPAIGTGNLVFVLKNYFDENNKELVLRGIDNDETLLSLTAISAELQQKKIHLTHQDALTNLLYEPSDLVVSDLPVGYYPIDDNAERFQTKSEEGHSFVHHLFIEQSMDYLKESGFGFFLVPGNLFDTAEAPKLLETIQNLGYFYGIVQLPKEWFKEQSMSKAILIVQKKGSKARQPKEVLLATAPDFKNAEAVKRFTQEIKLWKQQF
ncbi:class I SAM-dependent methyltransferase [Lacticigenium naphthae]|uniref:class I SAM-dependent methyltransferase n=1 Tax=Lacticigenium naphthae TaxID=515351 RepID=UPI000407C642|nr:class I SAM-dependent methyltransferase [Lacticigenium naphthae]